MARIVCNASPIIGLITIGKLSLLWELFDEVIIPHAVYAEVTCDRSSYPHHIIEIDEAVNSGKIKVFNVKNQEFIKQLYGKLHEGELEVVVGAKELGISTVIIDERAARNFASSMLLDTLGIIGILQLAKKQRIIAEIKKYLDELIKNRYRISLELYDRALEKAGEK
jgi:predicted nucleic acid-binding protein